MVVIFEWGKVFDILVKLKKDLLFLSEINKGMNKNMLMIIWKILNRRYNINF